MPRSQQLASIHTSVTRRHICTPLVTKHLALVAVETVSISHVLKVLSQLDFFAYLVSDSFCEKSNLSRIDLPACWCKYVILI